MEDVIAEGYRESKPHLNVRTELRKIHGIFAARKIKLKHFTIGRDKGHAPWHLKRGDISHGIHATLERAVMAAIKYDETIELPGDIQIL